MFQSTCLREAWPYRQYWCNRTTGFQSTCLREAWPDGVPAELINQDVSIHMPTWGMTQWHKRFQFPNHGFNPHAYVRHDDSSCRKDIRIWKFQSTCLREAWHPTISLSAIIQCFNPHAYVRHDGMVEIKALTDKLFQSTCLREAWQLSRNYCSWR